VLLNGNHEEIRRFRRQAAREKTARLRPDLLGARDIEVEIKPPAATPSSPRSDR
jgi:tRNA G37 N-methylase TrmD